MEKNFKISNLFGKVKLAKYYAASVLKADDNGAEYICASRFNNGVNKELPRVNSDGLKMTDANIIAWGKQCPTFTYHKNPCVASQGMYYISLGDNVTENVALYLITILKKTCVGYSYTNCLIGSDMNETIISLPVDSNGKPDFDYMEKYISNIKKKCIDKMEQDAMNKIAKVREHFCK